MARLIDSIEDEEVRESTVIVCDNVSKYYYAYERKTFSPYDIPNFAPPFPDMFIEWKLPNRINNNGVITDFSSEYDYAGVRLLSCVVDDNLRREFRAPLDDRAKWIMMIHTYLGSRKGDFQRKDISTALVIRDDGSFSGQFNSIVEPFSTAKLSEDEIKSYGIDIVNSSVVAFLALSFMHCKNVELKTRIPSIPLSKKYKKIHGRPLVRYRVLEIDPMKRILRTEGQSETRGLEHALHICRGHFKDYGKGGGLFGKYKGLYWWESHVRGHPSQGIVVKDYNVNPPNDQMRSGAATSGEDGEGY